MIAKPDSRSSSVAPETRAIRLAAGERAVFVGQPGSGKTNLEAAMLAGVESAIVIDSKRHPQEWGHWGPKHGFVVTSDPEQLQKLPKVVFQVSQRALLDRGGWRNPGAAGWTWTRALELIAKRRRPTVVVFDEVIQSLPAGGAHPHAVEIYTQGRAWGISCWAGSQIPNRMETLVVRLAEHCFSFWCGNQNDQRLLSSCRSVECAELGDLQKFHFAYHHAGEQNWLSCGPAPLVLKG